AGAGTGAAPSLASQELARQRCVTSNVGPPILRRLTQQEFQNTVADIFPQIASTWSGVKIGTDAVSALGFSNDAATLVVGQQTAQEILSTAEDVATHVTDDSVLPAILPCATSAADATCATQFISQYGARLFRRPLSADESKRYSDYFTSVSGRSSFKLGIKWTLVALFQSANAVYRSEVGVASGGKYALSQNEIATELAYNFGGSTPSADLLAKAAAGALSTPEARLAEARNLLTTANGKEAVRELFREWSGYALVKARTKTNTAFTGMSDDMTSETQQFIDDVVFTHNGTLSDLLTAPYTFLSAKLATYYGYGAPSADFARVDRPASWGIGLLAQGSLLAANAHADATSPTWRGLLVFQKMFCNSKPKPPASVPSIAAPAPGKTTTRQRYETSHIANPSCSACHTKWDPIGFAFEHFDELGRYRADEGGLPIDTTGYVLDDAGKKALTFDGATDLATQLASDPAVTDCVSGLVSEYVYAGGGGVGCLAETARTALSKGQFGLLEYLAQLSTERQFSERTLSAP
ncbi:MAG TPA: DUF1588 domain-containing protein, partial [Polyangiaceae bacterium]|nr:DUF1588 domain-containing protein [Polyangiaceae bacterium]